jgi:hypothetical protein
MGKSRRVASILLSILAATTLMAGLLGVPAAASTRAPAAPRAIRTVCPLESSGASGVPSACCEPVVAKVTLPCCPVPTAQPVCCPPTASATTPPCCSAQCLSGVTIAARPDPAVAGDSVTIAGTVLGGGATKVTLWQKLAGQSAFSALASTTSSSSGAYSFRRDVTRNLSWYVTAGSKHSITISEPVKAVLALKVGRSRMRRGTRVRITGSVWPADPDGRVTVLGRRGRKGSWRTLAHGRLDAASKFSLRIRLRRAGRWQLMASFGGDASNRGGRSPMVAVTVTR